jgi:hypothetical protein
MMSRWCDRSIHDTGHSDKLNGPSLRSHRCLEPLSRNLSKGMGEDYGRLRRGEIDGYLGNPRSIGLGDDYDQRRRGELNDYLGNPG